MNAKSERTVITSKINAIPTLSNRGVVVSCGMKKMNKLKEIIYNNKIRSNLFTQREKWKVLLRLFY